MRTNDYSWSFSVVIGIVHSVGTNICAISYTLLLLAELTKFSFEIAKRKVKTHPNIPEIYCNRGNLENAQLGVLRASKVTKGV